MAATISISTPSNGTLQLDAPHLDTPWSAAGSPPRRAAGPAVAGQREATVIYWRRRLIAGLVLIVLGAGMWTIATWALNSSVGVDPVGADRPAVTGPDDIYVVQPGDTLWSIASEVDPDGDVRATVDQLAEVNGGSAISVGQRLIVGR